MNIIIRNETASIRNEKTSVFRLFIKKLAE